MDVVLMAAWLTFLPISCVALIATSWLFFARWLAHRIAGAQFSVVRYLVWCAGIAAGIAGLVLVKQELGFAAIAAGLAFWFLLGSAIEIRGSELRRRIATLQLYAASFVLAQRYLDSRGMIEGTRASASHAYAIAANITGLAVPVAGPLLGKMSGAAWISPAGIAAAIAHVVSGHFLLAIALTTLALVAFAVAYLADRPLPALGLDVLPEPRAWTALFALALLVGAIAPAGPVATTATVIAIAICPFYVAESVVLLARWLSPLRSRHWLIATIVISSLALPFVGVLLVLLGVVAQLARLRELLPFAALTETPMRRPRLATLIWLSLGLTAVLGLSTLLGKRGLARASPRLGEGPELCGSVTSAVDWARGTVTFTTPETRYEMDVEETALPPGTDPSALCNAKGERLCTSDEWYLACTCTYPLDAESGPKWWTNQIVAARAEQERSASRLPPGSSTLSAEKQSEVRDLLAGRSEIVAGSLGGAALVAGPSERVADSWSIDCRTRAWLAPRAFELAPPDSIGVRCCR
jgi:hypothetical protein